jgi:minor extracellular serine protease Vpr
MKRKGFKSLIFALLLAMLIVPLASASDLGPIEPLVPVPSNDVFEAVNESFDMWFVEFRSPPVADGGNPRNTQSDKANFRAAAAKEGLAFEERFAFDTLWNGISLSINPQDVAKLANLPGIKGIYPVASIPIPETTTSDMSPEMYTALAMTGADVVQSEMGYTGEGIKVAIMDTGIDYDHPDLGGCFGEGCRVYTGWDFVGDAFTGENEPVPGPDPDDCNGHGTHVAGIVGASGVVTGVAPDVTFGAYRVFGCTGYTWADIMLAAMEMALEDGMHILNMSIGSAFQWPQYPTAVASDNLVKKGMVVVASIGNSGANGTYSAGAPGVGEKVIGVASFDNTDVYVPYFEVEDTPIGYIAMSFSPPVPTEGEEEIVYIGQACNADLPLMADPAGKVALAVRGACAFSEKAVNAMNAGAVAVVIQNNAPGLFSGTLGEPIPGIPPVVGISQADGLFIRAQEEPVYMTWTDEMTSAMNPTGGLISGFSSYGLAPDLSFKPDIGAPGGSIYAPYPLEKGGYATLGGTSMSSPHVAGAVALLLQANPRLKAEAVRDVLQNSAVPKNWWGNPGLGFLDNVHRQGAGMLQIDKAIMATTTITPAKLALGESEAGPVKQNIKLTNSSRDPVTYDLSYVNALSTAGTFTPGFFLGNAWVEFQKDSVTLPGRGAANINVTIHPATGPNHGLYGGYIVFTPQDGGQVLRVPYAGFVGDYQGIQVLTPTASGLFPTLGWTPDGEAFGLAFEGDVFTMVGYDIPYLLVHFDHPSQLFRVEIVNAQRDRLIHPVFNTAFYYDYLPRNSTAGGFFAFGWDGYRMHKDGHWGIANANLTGAVPDGEYQLVVHVLKANGQANNPAHWETWTSPMFVIDRP